MSDQQCGLCLSCGAPFLPDIDDIDFFNREANLSVLFLNTQFKQNPEIQRTYDVPKLCSKRQASHIVHVSYHQTALDYMCNRHTDDNDVGIGAGFNMVGGSAVPDLANAPFLYYHTASTKEGPKAATWARPPEDRRIDMGDLLDRIEEAYDNDPVHAQPFQPGRMYDICAGCNALMTQKSHFRFLLGCRGAGAKNMRGCIVARDAFTQYNVESRRHALPDAYGVWQVQNGGVRRAPRRIKTDSEAPAIAYYLHMCLPHQGAGQQNYFNRFRPTALRLATRQVYLELCWVILEIACLATLLDEGTATKPRETKRSHGRHQHLGVLDLYVSYFFWRLAVYCLGGRKQMDFVQFHQKFFSDARNCPGLLPESSRRVTTGSLMYSASSQSAKGLVEEICSYLMFYFKNELQPLVELCCGGGDVDKPIKEYFLQFDVVRILRARSNEATRNDFQSALGKFGINALLFRLIDLCEGYPQEFLRQLKDFRSSWQWREIERVRLAHPGYEAKSAFRLYYLCTLLNPPDDDGPFLKEVEDQIFQIREYCSPWTSVMSLDAIGAFRYQAIDAPLPDY